MPNPTPSHCLQGKYQRGTSLVGILIGMLISIISILSILALYKNLVHVSTDASNDASHDGQISTALMTTQLELQTAGYGIEKAGQEHINTNDDGSEIRWRYLDSGGYQCRAIQQQSPTPNTRALVLMEATSNCTEDSVLGELQWNAITTLTKFERKTAIDKQLFTFSVSTGNCSPYGMSTNKKHIIATITALSSAGYHDTPNVENISHQLCLVSTHPA